MHAVYATLPSAGLLTVLWSLCMSVPLFAMLPVIVKHICRSMGRERKVKLILLLRLIYTLKKEFLYTCNLCIINNQLTRT